MLGLKLTTGEEVICKIGKVTSTDFVAIDPLFLAQTGAGMALAPLVNTIADNNDPTLSRDAVAMHFIPHPNIISAWEETKSNIIVPEKSKIIV